MVPGLPAGPFGDCAPRGGASHIRFWLPAGRSREAATQKARPMFAPSTVPIAPHPAPSKEGQHCRPLLPRPGCICKKQRSSGKCHSHGRRSSPSG